MSAKIEENIATSADEIETIEENIEDNIVENITKVAKNEQNEYHFNIIATFSDCEQDIFGITLDSDDVKNEATFLATLFKGEDNLQTLIKYSVLQTGVTEAEMLPYLAQRGGKYYFTEECQNLLNFRNKFLKI